MTLELSKVFLREEVYHQTIEITIKSVEFEIIFMTLIRRWSRFFSSTGEYVPHPMYFEALRFLEDENSRLFGLYNEYARKLKDQAIQNVSDFDKKLIVKQNDLHRRLLFSNPEFASAWNQNKGNRLKLISS